MDDNSITAIVGWPTEPEMVKYRAVAQAASLAEREACVQLCRAVAENDVRMSKKDAGSKWRKIGATMCRDNIIKRSDAATLRAWARAAEPFVKTPGDGR